MHRGSRPPASTDQRYAQMRRVTLVGSVFDATLGVGKILGGWLAHSQALVADGIHSLSDLITDVMVLVAAKHSHAAADEEHPYGHGRIETVATVALGGSLVAVGIVIAYEAVQRMFDPESLVVPAAWALGLAALSAVVKEAIYHYTMHSARRLESDLLRANAWHSRSDAASSVVVMIGVGGALMGLSYLDAVAAVIVAWMVGRMGYRLARRSVSELIDAGLDPDRVRAIRDMILSVDGVEDLHLLRTRRMAGRALVDVHIILSDPRLSVSEGHQISETVRGRLLNRIDEVADVTVHIDPEDDEYAAPGRHLGLRREVLKRLRERWSDVEAAAYIKRVNLHYLDGKLHVELELPLDLVDGPKSAGALQQQFRRALAREPDIAEVRVLYS